MAREMSYLLSVILSIIQSRFLLLALKLDQRVVFEFTWTKFEDKFTIKSQIWNILIKTASFLLKQR